MTTLTDTLSKLAQTMETNVPAAQVYGRLVKVTGLLMEVTGCVLSIGQRCMVENRSGWIESEVVGFNKETSYLMPVEPVTGLFPGAKVSPLSSDSEIVVGDGLLGRVLDGLGRPLDDKGPLRGPTEPLHKAPINPLTRQPVTEPLDVGVKAINGLLTLGKGQRMGIFAGSGVGKSVLLGMITRFTSAEAIVVGLIGERNREVLEFLHHSLGEEGLARAVVIVAPSDASPLMRLRASLVCHRLAESFRDQGKHTLLLMDSLTRYAQAQREIALSLGEPPATKGFPPSVFSLLPQLVERAGNGANLSGSLSAIYTVLVEGDDHNDPIADAARAILDGHIVMRREIAEQGIYPAIDIAPSASRVISLICSPQYLQSVQKFRRYYSLYQQVRELIPLGGYQKGNDPEMDKAVLLYPKMQEFLMQHQDDGVSLADTHERLVALMAEG